MILFTRVEINALLQHALLPFTDNIWKYIHLNKQPTYFKTQAEDTNNQENQIFNNTRDAGNP